MDESRRRQVWLLEETEELPETADRIGQVEDRAALDGLIAALPPEQREAVLLRYGQDLSYKDIARVMGCPVRTAQSRVRNGLKTMRRRLENDK